MILRFLFGFLRRLFRRGNPNEATARGAAGSTLAEMSAGMRAQAQSVHGEIVALRRAVPTLELVRIASDDRAWLAEPEAAARLKALHEAGFTDGALWSYAGIPNLLGFDLIDATGSVHAAVMRQGTRVILELEQHLTDGSVCSVADSEAAKGITSPPWRRPQNRPGTAPEQLIADFLAEARARDESAEASRISASWVPRPFGASRPGGPNAAAGPWTRSGPSGACRQMHPSPRNCRRRR